jgi:hypothetical protein
MIPKLMIGIIAGLIGMVITLFICLLAQIMIATPHIGDAYSVNRELGLFFGGIAAVVVVFFIGCIIAGYFSATQRGVTRAERTQTGAWTGFIAGFLITVIPIFIIISSVVDVIVHIDGGAPSVSAVLRSICLAIVCGIFGTAPGILGSTLAPTNESLDISPN